MSHERRTSFRCSVQTDEEAAILRTDRADHMVRLVEKSAGGFGIVVEQRLDLELGQVFSLATSGGCCEVKVVHVESEEDFTRIGLQNIRDLKFLPGGSNWLTRRLIKACDSKYARIHLALIILLCLGFFIWGSSLSSAPDKPHRQSPTKPATQVSANGNDKPAKINDRDLALDHLNLSGLTKGKVVARLELTSDQKTRIDGILSDTAAALALVYDEPSGTTKSEKLSDVALQLVFFSGRQIEEVLTDEQRIRWHALIEESAIQAAADARGK